MTKRSDSTLHAYSELVDMTSSKKKKNTSCHVFLFLINHKEMQRIYKTAILHQLLLEKKVSLMKNTREPLFHGGRASSIFQLSLSTPIGAFKPSATKKKKRGPYHTLH